MANGITVAINLYYTLKLNLSLLSRNKKSNRIFIETVRLKCLLFLGRILWLQPLLRLVSADKYHLDFLL